MIKETEHHHTRRRLGAGIVAVSLSITLLGCASGSGDTGEGAITFVGYGGETQESQLKSFGVPFTEQSGAEVLSDSPIDYAKLKAMVESGNVAWDVVLLTRAAAVKYCGTLLEELPTDVVADAALVEGVEGTACSVPLYISQSMIAANGDTYGDNLPTSVADFFDTAKYPGKRLLPPDFDSGIMEYALLADGVAPEDLYPLDVDRALRKYDTIRESLVFAESYSAMEQAMRDGTVDMAQTVESRFGYLIRDGVNWTPVWDQTILLADQLAVPKGSENVALAEEFIEGTLDAKAQNQHGELTGRQSVVTTSEPNYEDYQRESLVLEDPADRGNVIWLDTDWWGENFDSVLEQYTAWQIG